MVDEVRREIERIREFIANGRLAQFDETQTKATAIEPILRKLGWDLADPDEVRREFPVRARPNARPVDYLLFCDDTPKVIVEAKRGNQSLQRHQEQLQDYVGFALAQRVKIAILTNGSVWWYYLPIRDTSWEQRRVATVEFNQQDSKEIAQTLVDLLSKENVCSGRAIQNAEKHQILETLPEVWNRLVSEPDSSVVNLLAEQTHRLCVREPDRNEVEQFLSVNSQQIQITSPLDTPPTDWTPEPVAVPDSDSPTESEPSASVRIPPPIQLTTTPDLTYTKPTSFKFNGEIHRVESWSGMMVRLCEVVRQAHRDRFDNRILNIRGRRGKIWFSRNRQDVYNSSSVINGTSIYVRTHGGGNEIVERAETLISHFGHNRNDFGFTAARKGEDPIKVRM